MADSKHTSLIPLNKLSEDTAEINSLPLSSKKPNYNHIESKVKKYRAEIRNQEKKKAAVESGISDSTQLDRIVEKITTMEDEYNDLTLDRAKRVIRDMSKKIENQEETLEVLSKQTMDLMKQRADLEIRMDFLRVELQRYKSMSESSSDKTKTPSTVKATYYDSLVNIFSTPIRATSKSLLTPFKNISRTSLPANMSSWSNEESETESDDCDEKFIEKRETIPIYNLNNSSRNHSSAPLMNAKSSPEKLVTRMKSFWSHIVSCSKLKMGRKKKRGKLVPFVEGSCIHAPYGASNYGNVNIDNFNNIEIPHITISSPTSNNTFVIQNAVKTSKKSHTCNLQEKNAKQNKGSSSDLNETYTK